MPLVLAGATSGSTTVQATDAVTATITLPSTTGTLVSTGSPASGNVIQVVNATYSTQTSNSTSTPAATGLTATITPKFATSKILVIVDQAGCSKDLSSTYLNLLLYRNGSSIFQFESEAGYTNSSATNTVGACSTNYLDSPATTSATTYATYFKSASNSAVVKVQASNSGSTMTLMEIAG